MTNPKAESGTLKPEMRKLRQWERRMAVAILIFCALLVLDSFPAVQEIEWRIHCALMEWAVNGGHTWAMWILSFGGAR